jgi:hypothetical protein
VLEPGWHRILESGRIHRLLSHPRNDESGKRWLAAARLVINDMNAASVPGGESKIIRKVTLDELNPASMRRPLMFALVALLLPAMSLAEQSLDNTRKNLTASLPCRYTSSTYCSFPMPIGTASQKDGL